MVLQAKSVLGHFERLLHTAISSTHKWNINETAELNYKLHNKRVSFREATADSSEVQHAATSKELKQRLSLLLLWSQRPKEHEPGVRPTKNSHP